MSSEILRGTLKSDGTLELKETSSLPPGPVRVIIEQLPFPSETTWDVLQRLLNERQKQRMIPHHKQVGPS